jgi:hypothetical protein
MGVEKINLKEFCEDHDLINGQDYFNLESPVIAGVMVVAKGRITQDTSPMFKIDIERVEVAQPEFKP